MASWAMRTSSRFRLWSRPRLCGAFSWACPPTCATRCGASSRDVGPSVVDGPLHGRVLQPLIPGARRSEVWGLFMDVLFHL
eukprot:361985-Chlamydomonas_euryale.AAC.3